MDPATVGVGAGFAAAGSLVTGVLLRSYERHRQTRDAGLIEVLRKRDVDRYEALRQLQGVAAELLHQTEWFAKGEEKRRGDVQSLAGKLRQDARRDVGVVGKDVVAAAERFGHVMRETAPGSSETQDRLAEAYKVWVDAVAAALGKAAM